MLSFFRAKDRTDEILRRHLDSDFSCFSAQDGAPSREALLAVAARFKCKLPADFLAHSTGRLGGICIEVKEEIWPRPKQYDVGPAWGFLYGFWVFGLAPDIPDFMNIELAAAKFCEETGRSFVPCLQLACDADLYLFNDAARIVRWVHEGDELEEFSGSFFDLLEKETRELRQRKDKKRQLS